MKFSEETDSAVPETSGLKRLYLLPAISGITGLILTFLIASSGFSSIFKILTTICVAAGYSAFYLFLYKTHRKASGAKSELNPVNARSAGEKLLALEEAQQFFGTSLSSADMFRLISSRVSDIFPADATAIFLADENGKMRIAHADGRNCNLLAAGKIGAGDGVAALAFSQRVPAMSANIEIEAELIQGADLGGIKTVAAIPLFHEHKVFGVYLFYSTAEVADIEPNIRLMEAIGERIAPIFRGSIELERSFSTALADPVTNLPNERAFFMILENQLAESQRYRDDRPLTVLAIDIKGFSGVNDGYGHATGDKLLVFAAELITDQLRKMDFLSRSVNDEFVVILPTANDKTAAEIVERIKASFVATPFAVTDKDQLKIWLNFGLATFWQDGETPQQLLQNARQRKRQAKSEGPSKLLWFPKEYVN